MSSFLSPVALRWAIPYGLILDGDSIENGYDVDGSITAWTASLPVGSQRLKVAVTGQTIAEMTGRLATYVKPWAKDAIIIAGGGFNDLLRGDATGSYYDNARGADAAGTYARLLAYVAQLRTYSPRAIVVSTCVRVAPATTYYTANLDTQTLAYNALVLGTVAGTFDGVVDRTSAVVERSSDGLHPDQLGQSTLATLYQPALASALP